MLKFAHSLSLTLGMLLLVLSVVCFERQALAENLRKCTDTACTACTATSGSCPGQDCVCTCDSDKKCQV